MAAVADGVDIRTHETHLQVCRFFKTGALNPLGHPSSYLDINTDSLLCIRYLFCQYYRNYHGSRHH